jgi:uncharacterized membrane protein YeaQ/YmgE (transglycosylase-associated protein family)
MLTLIGEIFVLGTIAGIIARLIAPGPKTALGFVRAVLLGIAGSLAGPFLWTLVMQIGGVYRADQGAPPIAALIGAVLLLLIWISWRTISGGRKEHL